MSLFPAYADKTVTPTGTVGDSKTPSWLTNTSFADFQGSLENQQTSIAISSDEADPLEAANVIIIKSDEEEARERSGEKKKRPTEKSSTPTMYSVHSTNPKFFLVTWMSHAMKTHFSSAMLRRSPT